MKDSVISRREFLGTAAAATIFAAMPLNFSCTTRNKKPDYKGTGVQLGCTTYSYRNIPHSLDEVLGYLLQAGINAVEMRLVLEEGLGIPQPPQRLPRNADDKTKAEYVEAVKAIREEQRKWRLSLSMDKYEEILKMYNDAGVEIHIAKFAPASWSDEEIDYAYNATKVLRAYGITDECSDAACQRLGPFAEKHKKLAIYHTHQQFARPDFDIEKLLSYSPANRLNFDAGHYFGATGLHPNNIIEKYHNVIPMIHMKDKTGPKSDPPDADRPFGKGEVPIADVLLLLKKEKWPIDVFVEMEYDIPEGSDAAKEVTNCIEYMRNILE